VDNHYPGDEKSQIRARKHEVNPQQSSQGKTGGFPAAPELKGRCNFTPEKKPKEGLRKTDGRYKSKQISSRLLRGGGKRGEVVVEKIETLCKNRKEEGR